MSWNKWRLFRRQRFVFQKRGEYLHDGREWWQREMQGWRTPEGRLSSAAQHLDLIHSFKTRHGRLSNPAETNEMLQHNPSTYSAHSSIKRVELHSHSYWATGCDWTRDDPITDKNDEIRASSFCSNKYDLTSEVLEGYIPTNTKIRERLSGVRHPWVYVHFPCNHSLSSCRYSPLF